MSTRKGLISYDGLPIASGGGHRLGRLKTKDAWAATLQFLNECTTTVGPSRVTLAINGVEDTDPQLLEQLRESAVAGLGLYPSPHDRQDYGGRGSTLTWHVSPEKAPKAVAWRDAIGPLPSNWLGGPALLSMDFQFRLKASTGNLELPYQDSGSYLHQAYDGYGALLGESGCRLTLSSRSTLSVLLFLPFEEPGPDLWQYVSFLQSRLPFRFSPRHWKHWRLTKKGTSYVGKKIKEPVLAPGEAAARGDLG